MSKKRKPNHPHPQQQSSNKAGGGSTANLREKDARDNSKFFKVLGICTLLLLIFMYLIFNYFGK